MIAPEGTLQELFRVPARVAAGANLLIHPAGNDLVHVATSLQESTFRVWDRTLARLVYPGDRTRRPAGEFHYFDPDESITYQDVTFAGPDRLALRANDRIVLLGYIGPDPHRDRDLAQLTRRAARLVGASDGGCLAIATDRGTVVIWDVLQGRLMTQIKLGGRAVPQAMAINSIGVLALALAEELRFYDTATGSLIGSSLTGKPITRLTLAPTSDSCLSNDTGAGVTVWREGKPLGRYDFDVGKVRAMVVAPTGLTAAVGGTARMLALIDLEG